MLPFRYRFLRKFMQVFFDLLYQPFAWTYDGIAAIVSLQRWKNWIYTVLPYLKGPQILELGHGPGHLQVALHQKTGLQTFGLDLSPQMGRQARRRLEKLHFTPNLVNGQAQCLPYPEGSFQQVVATFPSEYIFHPDTMAEVYRVLTPGGEFIVLPLAWITGRSPLQRAAAWLFKFTGQAPEWNEAALAGPRLAGFEAEAKMVELETSQVLIVTGRKPDLQ